VRGLQTTVYKEGMASGGSLGANTETRLWNDVPPGTVTEAIMNTACGR
jgi:hypothetical protein